MTREEFILSNKNLVLSIARYYYGICREFGIEFEDLRQVGYLALAEKYGNYDEKKGKASTYAVCVIQSAMINYINFNNSITHMPKNFSYFANIIANRNQEFYLTNGRYMTKEEILDMMKNIKYVNYKRTMDLVEKVLEVNNHHLKKDQLPLNEVIDEETGETFMDYIRTSYNMEDAFLSQMNCENILANIINEPRNYDIVTETLGLNDGIPKTREQLAEKYYTSEQVIDKKYKKSLGKLKAKVQKMQF